MDDTINRQLAIDELIKMLVDCFQADEELVDAVVTTIKDLPAAEPNLQSTCNKLATDTISRAAAIEATWFEPSYADPLNVLTEVRDKLKALPSAQPEQCEDAVSRKLAIRAFTQLWSLLKTVADRDEWEDICRTTANILRPVTPEPRWIPCSERLPEESGLYIVTNVGRWVEPVGTRYYNIRADGGFWSGHPGDKVLAWMELPPAYKEDTE